VRQIVSRLTQTLDEDSKTGGNLTKIYKELGISLKDSHGQIRSTYDILKDLSKQWNGLSKNQQQYIAITSAGSNQIENFNALMSHFSTAISATETAENSAGSATKENSKYMESLSAKLNALKGQLQELVIGDGSLSAFMKGVVDAGTAILKFANSDIGKTIIELTLAYTGFSLAAKGIHKFKAAMEDTEKVTGLVGLIKNIKAAITAFKGAETATEGFKAALGALNINPVVLGLTAAVAGGIALYKVYKYLNPTVDECNKKLEEQSKKLQEAKSAYEKADEAVKKQSDKLENINQKIQEIQSKGTLTITDQAQLKLLQQEKIELQNQLTLLEAQREIKRKEAEDKARETLTKKTKVKIYQVETSYSNGLVPEQITSKTFSGTIKDNLDQLSKAYDTLNTKLDLYGKELDRLNSIPEDKRTIDEKNLIYQLSHQLIPDANKGLEDMMTQIVKSDNVVGDADATVSAYGGSLRNVDKGIKDVADSTMGMVSAYNSSKSNIKDSNTLLKSINGTLGTNYTSTKQVSKALKKAGQDYKSFDRAIKEGNYDEANKLAQDFAKNMLGIGDASGKSADEVVTYADALNNSMSNISSIQSAYGNLKAAVDEYNKSGQISFETLSSIISQNPAYLACLDNSSGKLSINEAMLKQQFNAQKQAAIATLEAARTYALEQVQLGATANEAIIMALSSKQMSTQVGQAGDSASKASGGISVLGNNAANASGQVDGFKNSVVGLTSALSDNIAQLNEWHKAKNSGSGNSSAKGNYTYKATIPGMPSSDYDKWAKSQNDSVNKNAEIVNKKIDSMEKTINSLSWKNIKATASVPSSGGGGRSSGGGGRRSKGSRGGSASSKENKALKNAQNSVAKATQKRINKLKKEKKALENSNKAMQARIDKLSNEKDHFDDLKGYIDDAFDEEIDNIDKQLDALEKKYDNMTVGEGLNEKLSDIAPKFDGITTSVDQSTQATKDFNTAVGELKDKYKGMKISDALDDVKEQLDLIDRQVDEYKKQQEVIRNTTVYAGKLTQFQGKTYKELKRTLVLKQREKEDDADILRYTEQIADLQYQLNLSENEGSIKQKTDQVNAYQNQIDALQEQIDAQKEVNDELDKQIERQKLLDALSAAKNKRLKVYQKGKGFTYTQDFDAIKKAQDDLDNYDRQHKTDDLQKQIDELEKKQKVLNDEITKEKDSYQKQIDALQWAKDKKEKLYDDQINELQRFVDDCDDKYDDATDDTVDAYLIQQKARKDNLENQQYYLEKLQNALDKEYEAQKENLENTKQMVQDKKDAFDKEYEAYEKHAHAVELFKEAGIEEGKSMLDQTTALDAFVDHAIAKYKELDKAKKTYNPQISQNKKSIATLDKEIDKQGEYKDKAKDAKTVKDAKKIGDKSKTSYKKTNKKVVKNTNLGSYKATMQQKAADLQVQVDNGDMSTEEAAKSFNKANATAKKKYGLKTSEGYKNKELDTKRWGNVTTEQQRINAGGKLPHAKYQKETNKTDKNGNIVRIGTGIIKAISIQGKIKKPLTTTAKMGTTTPPKKKTTTSKKPTTKKTTTSNKKKTTKVTKKKKKYTGDPSISQNGIYLVGDKPSQELVIGSKLNGVPLNLDKGTGVVNAKSTSTLAGMLNTLSSDKEHIGTLNKNTSTTNNDNLSIGSVTVSGANINDGESFVASLKTLKQEALQRAYRK
jgi:chromosome segregation ATPase